jgi:hypothetical protein
MYTRFSYISYLVSSILPSALMRLISCFSIFTLKSNAFLSPNTTTLTSPKETNEQNRVSDRLC